MKSSPVLSFLVKLDDGEGVTSIEVHEQRLLPENDSVLLNNRDL